MTAPTVPEMKDGLLPCPFCGGPAREWEGGDGYATIGCEAGRHRCRAQAAVYDHRDRAIAAWNTRAMIAATQQATGGEAKGARWAMVQAREVLSRLQYAKNAKDFDESRLMGVAILDNALATQQAVSPPEGVGERGPWLQMIYELRHPERERVGWQDNADLMRDAADEIERLARTERKCGHGVDDGSVCLRCAELQPIGDASQDRPHRNAADGGSSNEGGEA